MISNKNLINLDRSIKRNLQKSIDNKNFDFSLRLIEFSAHLQYSYGFYNSLYDKVLEDALKTIADANFQTINIIPEENTVMFYDFFGYDNRGLSQQYLRALRRLNKRIILVFENKTRHYKNEAILSEIADYNNKSVYYLEGDSKIELCRNLIDILAKEKPQEILMHLSPEETVAYMAFYKISGVRRYQINLTDHAFWLGVDITDINVEFRSYGLNLSEQLRHIPTSKNRILPFYPILSKVSFQGFDFDYEGKKIIFSGSSIYKTLGNNLEFFDTIYQLLKTDENLIFVLAGSGNKTAIIKYIDDHKLNDRFFLIGDRYDLYEIMKIVDYYISTFPFTGALMTQIAVAAKCPVFAYVHPQSLFNDLEDLFYKSDDFENIPSKEELIVKFRALHNNSYQKTVRNNQLITEEEFAENLKKIFEGGNPLSYLEKRESVLDSYVKFNTLMLESENLYNPTFERTCNNFLTHQERKKIIPGYQWKYYWKRFNNNKIDYIKALYNQFIKF